MLNFHWNSLSESTFQGFLNKYTNAFKRYQLRYFVLDIETKSLLYFMPDEVQKKGPRGLVELTDACIVPSDEDDMTFSIQNIGPEVFKLRATDAKERKKWIDNLRACSGFNAAQAYTIALPQQKNNPNHHSLSLAQSPKEHTISTSHRQQVKVDHHQQTIRDLKEMMRCVEIHQRTFLETVDILPDDLPLHSLSKDMLLFRSIARSCVNSLEDSLTILVKGRTLNNPYPSRSSSINQSANSNASREPRTSLSQSFNESNINRSNSVVSSSPPTPDRMINSRVTK